MDKVELNFTKDALMEISKMALTKKTGARGLRAIMEKLLQDVMFEIPGSNVESVEVTKEAVMGMAGPTFYYAQDKDVVEEKPGSNDESVEVTKEAVMGMAGPTFYYAQ